MHGKVVNIQNQQALEVDDDSSDDDDATVADDDMSQTEIIRLLGRKLKTQQLTITQMEGKLQVSEHCRP
jgi:hypothetical protein